ncbi:hypothetical protein AVEN_271473-1 [Araneus ventricosus]|uniref:Uncharacterized protein n=1 Tax=Araneus ventricosus TaxID=182803 RepID=A0A4Y2KQD8_ARAVE|nr:hypothetical protein AVEN_271473-1 [Araneus ventricosus]
MVWVGVSINGRIINNEALTAQKYRDEILTPIVVPYSVAIRDKSILTDDNARPHHFDKGSSNGLASIFPRHELKRTCSGHSREKGYLLLITRIYNSAVEKLSSAGVGENVPH